MILYGMEAAPYNEATLTILDGLLAKATKKSYGVMACAPTAMTHSDILDFGMACPSIKVEYNQKCTAALVEASNDTSRDGIIARAILSKHILNLHKLELQRKAGEYPYAMTLRQLACAQHSQIAIVLKGQEQYPRDTCQLVDQMKTLRYDSHYVGLLKHLPNAVLSTMAELGITDMEELLDRNCNSPTIFPASHLQMKYGICQARHRHALNVLTTAMNLEYPIGPDEYKKMTKDDLPLDQRKIHPTHAEHLQAPKNDSLITTYFPVISKDEIHILVEHTKEIGTLLGISGNGSETTHSPEQSQATDEGNDSPVQEQTTVDGRRNSKRSCNEAK
jgi:hypothetical protein